VAKARVFIERQQRTLFCFRANGVLKRLVRLDAEDLAANEDGGAGRDGRLAAHFDKCAIAAAYVFEVKVLAAMVDLAVGAAHERILGEDVGATAPSEADLFFIERQARGRV
jgi:hypothetical protein